MLVALGGPQKGPQRKVAKETGLARSKLNIAGFVIANAPDHVELVLAGSSLEKARISIPTTMAAERSKRL